MKTRKQKNARYKIIKYYKWEFLRRNDKYAKEHQHFVETQPTLCELEGNKKLSEKFYRKSKSFANKWKLQYYPNPDYPGPEDNLTSLKICGHDDDVYPYSTEPNYKYVEGLADYEIWMSKRRKGKCKRAKNIYKPLCLERIKVEIKLDRPKENIIHEIHRIVNAMKKVRAKKGYSDLKKPNLKLFDEYLLIYDLRVCDKLSFVRIAEKLYPLEFRASLKKMEPKGKVATNKEKLYKEIFRKTNDVDAAYKGAYGEKETGKQSNKTIQKVIDRFNAAKRLVDGGYKDIW